jgi:hypothetical protein
VTLVARATLQEFVEKRVPVEFVLAGFSHDHNIRTYTFQAIAADRTHRLITVGADMDLIRKHRIPLQELPLLCRRLLEGNIETPDSDALMFTEKDMIGYAQDRSTAAEAAAQKRRAHPIPVPNRTARQGDPDHSEGKERQGSVGGNPSSS